MKIIRRLLTGLLDPLHRDYEGDIEQLQKIRIQVRALSRLFEGPETSDSVAETSCPTRIRRESPDAGV